MGKEVSAQEEAEATGRLMGQEDILLQEGDMGKEAKDSEKEGNQEKAHRTDIAVLIQEAL